MKAVLLCAAATALAGAAPAQTAQSKKPVTLREVLLAELKSTHNSEEWFVPVDVAVKDLTPEQAAWRAKENHSVGQLVYHLWIGTGGVCKPSGARSLRKPAATTTTRQQLRPREVD